MTHLNLSNLSSAGRAAIERALTAAFGTSPITGLSPVSGGMSGAAVFRIRVEGSDYLLRLEPPADTFRNPVRGHACMQIAAQASLAPRLRHACSADGVAIMDFVQERPLGDAFNDARGSLMVELGRLVRALHLTPPFPFLVDYLDGLDALTGSLGERGFLDQSARDQTLEAYHKVAAAYRRLEPDLVSSHNDINPRNLLFDGERLWLVDWESAFLADRYVDLASVINFFARDAGEEEILLDAYLGAPPSEAQRARLYLARQINHVFYGVMLLNAAAAERPGTAGPGEGPSLSAIHGDLAAGVFDLDSWEGRVAYGRARLRALVEGVASPWFSKAVLAAS